MNKFKKKVQEYDHWQRLIICICIAIVCIGSQKIQTSAWNSGSVEFFRDLCGILMAIIIMTIFRRHEITEHKRIYIAWTLIALTGSCIWIPLGFKYRYEYLKADTAVLAIAFWLMGYCMIYTALNIIKDRKAAFSHFHKPLMIVWLIMFVLMMTSRSTYLWPEAYFALFTPFYLTKQTESQRKEILIGLSNGLILGFMLVQCHSMLTRPFDHLLYYGNFSNPNHNCMFLCMCLAGILGRILIASMENERKIIKAFLISLLGADLSFIFMTGCKSGFLATFVLVIIFLSSYCILKKKKVFIRLSIGLLILFVVSMPISYLAIRYIPTIHPHVNFYANDSYSLDRVHYYDPYDSDKFTSFKEVVNSSFGKIQKLIDTAAVHLGMETKDTKVKIVVKTLGSDIGNNPDKIPLLPEDAESSDPILIRYTIYKWYFDHLSLRGSRYDEQGFQLTESHWIQDTHNIYLDYGINFGWPVMVIFAGMIWWGIARVFRKVFRQKDVYATVSLLILIVPPVFGLFEYSWGPGMISTIALYICMKEFLVK